MINDKLREAFSRVQKEVESDPHFNTGIITVRARVTDGVKQEAIVGGQGKGYEKAHTLVADERELLGGTNTGPAPLEYFVAGLNFCYQSTMLFIASSKGINYELIETTSKAYFNRRGIYVDGDPSFSKITLDVMIRSSESPESILELIKATEKSCCVHATLSKILKIETNIFLNGNRLERRPSAPLIQE